MFIEEIASLKFIQSKGLQYKTTALNEKNIWS